MQLQVKWRGFWIVSMLGVWGAGCGATSTEAQRDSDNDSVASKPIEHPPTASAHDAAHEGVVSDVKRDSGMPHSVATLVADAATEPLTPAPAVIIADGTLAAFDGGNDAAAPQTVVAGDDNVPPSDAGADAAEPLIIDDLTLLVVFDNSGSMDTYWDGQSRWQAANDALKQAIEPVQTSLKVGAIRFPLGEQCDVPEFGTDFQFDFMLGEQFLAEWTERGALPAGGTPLAQALLAADAAIGNARESGLLDERFRVIIVTDGEPNCDGDPALLTSLPAKWHERGVETHVLGLPGSTQAAALLDSIAAAGGGHHQSLTSPDELIERTTALAR